MRLIRNFIIVIGPISSICDFLTSYVLLHFFHASQTEFHIGWVVESLATQRLALFVIRTMGSMFKSSPSVPFTITTILAVVVGVFASLFTSREPSRFHAVAAVLLHFPRFPRPLTFCLSN
jgi:hypothetical protein